MTEKISVIVPVYKVEAYLRKCLDSIVAQTYKNLEIILVDDGSPDNCGAICDEYAARDERIIVIHQQNGGISAARNAALDIATGDYIGFVDSDDWIEPDMYEYLLTGALEENADITICGRYDELPAHSTVKTSAQRAVMDGNNGLRALLEDVTIHNHVWDKLYVRRCFDGVRFPKGMVYEDVATTYKCFVRAWRILCLPQPKYHYLQRLGSIVGTPDLANRIQLFIAARQRMEALSASNPQFADIALDACICAAVPSWCSYYASSPNSRTRFLPQLEEMAALSRQRLTYIKNTAHFGITGRIVLRLTPYAKPWAFLLARLCSMAYKLKHKRYL